MTNEQEKRPRTRGASLPNTSAPTVQRRPQRTDAELALAIFEPGFRPTRRQLQWLLDRMYQIGVFDGSAAARAEHDDSHRSCATSAHDVSSNFVDTNKTDAHSVGQSND